MAGPLPRVVDPLLPAAPYCNAKRFKALTQFRTCAFPPSSPPDPGTEFSVRRASVVVGTSASRGSDSERAKGRPSPLPRGLRTATAWATDTPSCQRASGGSCRPA